jgi:tetratricopeptide (TPR) repeat protein
VSVFPAGFTLEGAEAVAGDGAREAVLRLVDCSLLAPPTAGPDGRSRYVMLETLRAYGTGLLAEAGERDRAAAALAGYALRVAEDAAMGLATGAGEAAAARRLDAEDATTRQVLAWAMERDADISLRLAVALAPWWYLRGRLTGEYSLHREAALRVVPGGGAWCAAQLWLGIAAVLAGDMAGALGHFTEVRDAIGDSGPSRALAECLAHRSVVLLNLGRNAEALDDGRHALALARELRYAAGEALALQRLSVAASYAGNLRDAVRLARQAAQITADIPAWIARLCISFLTFVLTEAGDLAAAEHVCAAGLTRARDAGDLGSQTLLLIRLAMLDLEAGRAGSAAAHLREGLQIAVRTGSWLELRIGLYQCGDLCAATGRAAEALTLWAACVAVDRHQGLTDPPWFELRWEEQLRQAREALGAGRARAAEDRGAEMSLATAAEYALLLTDPGPPQPTPLGSGQLSARERELVRLVARAVPTPRSPPSCTSAPARSARTWTGSGTRPAAAAVPT